MLVRYAYRNSPPGSGNFGHRAIEAARLKPRFTHFIEPWYACTRYRFTGADRWENVYFNLSNVYMTGLMAGSMLPIMLATMLCMFKNRKLNAVLWLASAVVLALFWGLLRAEAGVGDRQFLRAMISHHSAAIQMCNESSLSDPRVKGLCQGIVSSQEREIAEMKAFLQEVK